jgi:acetyl-CoA carboxylase alpha subunit
MVVSKIKLILARDFEILSQKSTDELLNDRYEKFRKMGPYKDGSRKDAS